MKIAIIGAGWVGCFIADKLINKNYNVDVYEKEKDIFPNASGNNQNRLHQGFHYPRSKKTILQCTEGFIEFKNKFGNFCKSIPQNYYFISKDERTKLSFKKYKSVFKKLDINYKNLNTIDFSFLKNIEGGIKCEEELILFKNAKKYYKDNLKKFINFNKEIKKITKVKNKYKIFGNYYDFVINCSYMQYSNFQTKNYTYEFCIMFKYKTKDIKHPAITIMDGPFFTLYPWDDHNNFGLYSVEKSRIITNSNFKKLKKKVREVVNPSMLLKQRKTIEQEFQYYYPEFKNKFKFVKYLKSYRTIINSSNDSRISYVKNENNFIDVLSAKIDHIFYVFKETEKYLKKF